VAELIATGALEARAPFEAGEAWLGEVAVAPLTAIAPFRGRTEAVDAALTQALGLGFPPPGRVLEAPGGRIAWSGREQALLMGAEAPDLGNMAAVTDLSDGWVALRLHGADAAAVLARLAPLDLRRARFGPGSAVRTLLAHIMALILRREDCFEILVMRSFAASAWHEIEASMAAVAARRQHGLHLAWSDPDGPVSGE
jgi:heterotetrameric sarcosine oxidase gamma subunit